MTGIGSDFLKKHWTRQHWGPGIVWLQCACDWSTEPYPHDCQDRAANEWATHVVKALAEANGVDTGVFHPTHGEGGEPEYSREDIEILKGEAEQHRRDIERAAIAEYAPDWWPDGVEIGFAGADERLDHRGLP